MRVEEVTRVVRGTFGMSVDSGDRMTRHITEHRPRSVLELGFQHGVSSCYIAAALDELDEGGHLTTIDLVGARDAEPNIEHLLGELGLRSRVTIVYEPTSYTWRLMRMLESQPKPSFDLCYLDGAHNWFVDGLAFFLVDRLLEADGWLILDDLDWTYATSPSLSKLLLVAEMPPDERETAQVRKIWELLVKTHPSYGDFSEEGAWGFARKLEPTPDRQVAIEFVRERYGAGQFLSDLAKKLLGAVRPRTQPRA